MVKDASITTTERYDNQTQQALLEAARRLETDESFKNLSRSSAHTYRNVETDSAQEHRKLLEELTKDDGVSEGNRTPNIRSHSPALYP